MADPLATVPSGRAADPGPAAPVFLARAVGRTPAVPTQTARAVSAFDQAGPGNALASGTRRALLNSQDVGTFNPVASLDTTRQQVERSFNPVQRLVEQDGRLTTIAALEQSSTERFLGEATFNAQRLAQEALPLREVRNQSSFRSIALSPRFLNGDQRTAIPGPPFSDSASANAVTAFQFVRSNTGSILDTSL